MPSRLSVFIPAVSFCAAAFLALSFGFARAEDIRPDDIKQVFRASDWKGGTDIAFEGCKANSGEYTLWVYARGKTCGVPREQADRIVMFRQPLPGVSPVRATSNLPGGSYFVWAYGNGDPGHPWINLCGRTCVKGELPPTPDWVLLGSIDVREMHQLWLKTWEQPDGHELSVHAIVLSASDHPPPWKP